VKRWVNFRNQGSSGKTNLSLLLAECNQRSWTKIVSNSQISFVEVTATDWGTICCEGPHSKRSPKKEMSCPLCSTISSLGQMLLPSYQAGSTIKLPSTVLAYHMNFVSFLWLLSVTKYIKACPLVLLPTSCYSRLVLNAVLSQLSPLFNWQLAYEYPRSACERS